MVQKNEAVQMLMASGLKHLMLKYPFEKITIKMITDEAKIVRPTFYHYFQDKYELLEWIFEKEIIDTVKLVSEHGLSSDTLRLFFSLLEKDRLFYQKAFEVTGQNAFERIVNEHIYKLFLERLHDVKLVPQKYPKLLTPEAIARYHALGLVNMIKLWLFEAPDDATIDDVTEAYFFMLSHTLFDLVDQK